jgi:hypothetical protein
VADSRHDTLSTGPPHRLDEVPDAGAAFLGGSGLGVGLAGAGLGGAALAAGLAGAGSGDRARKDTERVAAGGSGSLRGRE